MLLIGAAMSVAQASSTAIEPSGPWTLSTTEDGCTVSRTLADQDTTAIALQGRLETPGVILMIAGSSRVLPQGIGEMPVRIDESDVLDFHYGAFETDDPKTRVLKLFPNEAALARLSSASTIVAGSKTRPIQISGFGKAWTALRRCMSEKLVGLNVDPKLYFEGKTAGTSGDFGSLFGAGSYPREAREARKSGPVVVLLQSASDGSITRCRVIVSADASLDEGTCKAAERGRLRPPLDDGGQPIASYAVVRVVWSAP